MKTTVSLLLFLIFSLNNLQAQIGRLALSPLQKIEQNIGVTSYPAGV